MVNKNVRNNRFFKKNDGEIIKNIKKKNVSKKNDTTKMSQFDNS